MVIVFALIPHRQHGHGFGVIDFKQRHIAGGTEGEGQLALEGVVRRGLPATERRIRQQIQAIAGGIPCSLGGGSVTAITYHGKLMQALKVGQRFLREADLECYGAAFFVLANRASSFFGAAADEKYTLVTLARSRDANPRAMKAACSRRC